jgi:hypothetical protein
MSITTSSDCFGIHDVFALFVDDLALIIHHVIIFDDLLADVVVAGFDLFLRGLDRLGQPARADRFAIFQIGSSSWQTACPARRCAADHLQGRDRTWTAGVALTARTAAQLVVDAAAFMALGADHVKAAGIQHLLLVPRRLRARSARSCGIASAVGPCDSSSSIRMSDCRPAECRCRGPPCWWRWSLRRAAGLRHDMASCS